ncbi:hypothetical protein GRX03_04155 [Halovenus sp. WSH3]|uniref:Uncharacterized protein n=1 Tax=Halovenus carboxidivorans TaxID=2692199 RepID=A0A6B0TC69_9EURY|nr:hypothetical protein [Halovenus carboxidivorans]MXR50799.1 hypothetical protein [Halovenus carboxidivorans]
MSDDSGDLSPAELAEYCRTQAGLLAGRTETIAAETDELLDEIDEDIAVMRDRLEGEPGDSDASADSSRTDETADAAAELEQLEADIEQRQAVAEANRARMAAIRDLSENYAELAADLDTVDGEQEALERIVAFEQEHDASAYFDDRQTLLEAVAESNS